MRHAISYLIVFCVSAALAFGQGVPATAPKTENVAKSDADRDAIQRLEEDWQRAERNTDVALLDRILAENYVNLTPRGIGRGKAEIIEHLHPHAGEAPPYSVEASDMHIYVLGDTAVTAYVKSYIAKENSNIIREDTTHIFAKDQGQWKLKISRASVCVWERLEGGGPVCCQHCENPDGVDSWAPAFPRLALL